MKKLSLHDPLCGFHPVRLAVFSALLGLPFTALAETTAAQDSGAGSDTLPVVEVSDQRGAEPPSESSGDYTVRSSATATRLNTSLRETPQSISVITRSQIDDFRLNSVNEVLRYATGVKVEQVEPDRSYYTARGSDITNFQIDGIGTPFAMGLVFGDLDTAIYDRVEVLRGANGLLTGTGNPSATINFIRKRPTADFQLEVDASAGSWDYRRADIDVSGG